MFYMLAIPFIYRPGTFFRFIITISKRSAGKNAACGGKRW
jgi:hypothetical protein